jgi:hypothetical protein
VRHGAMKVRLQALDSEDNNHAKENDKDNSDGD